RREVDVSVRDCVGEAEPVGKVVRGHFHAGDFTQFGFGRSVGAVQAHHRLGQHRTHEEHVVDARFGGVRVGGVEDVHQGAEHVVAGHTDVGTVRVVGHDGAHFVAEPGENAFLGVDADHGFDEEVEVTAEFRHGLRETVEPVPPACGVHPGVRVTEGVGRSTACKVAGNGSALQQQLPYGRVAVTDQLDAVRMHAVSCEFSARSEDAGRGKGTLEVVDQAAQAQLSD